GTDPANSFTAIPGVSFPQMCFRVALSIMNPVMILSRAVRRRRPTSYIVAVMLSLPGLLAANGPSITLEIKDYAALPITGLLDGKSQTDGMLARVNSLLEEPGRSNRFFVNDLNGPLYILDETTRKFTTYLNFNGRAGRPGIFHKLSFDTGYAGGLVSVQFDPDYLANGRFYTVH